MYIHYVVIAVLRRQFSRLSRKCAKRLIADKITHFVSKLAVRSSNMMRLNVHWPLNQRLSGTNFRLVVICESSQVSFWAFATNFGCSLHDCVSRCFVFLVPVVVFVGFFSKRVESEKRCVMPVCKEVL